MRINTKIFVITFIGAITAYALMSFVIWREYTTLISTAQEQLRNQSLILSEHAARSFEGVSLIMDAALSRLETTPQGDPQLTPHNINHFKALVGSAPQVRHLVAIRRDGTDTFSNIGGPRKVQLADRAYFKVQKKNVKHGIYIDEPVIGRATGRSFIPASHRISGKDGRFDGILMAVIDQKYFRDFYKTIETNQRFSSALISTNGVVFAWSDNFLSSDPKSLLPSVANSTLFNKNMQSNHAGLYTGKLLNPDAVEYVSYTKVPKTSYTIITRINRSVVLSDWAEKTTILLVLGVILTFGLFSFSLSTARQASLREKAEAELITTNENLEQIVDVRTQEIAENERRFRLVLDNALIAIVTIDEKGIIQSANHIAEDTFGYGQEELLGQNVKMLMPEPFRSGHDAYLENYNRGGEPKIIGSGREVEGRRKDGSIFPMALGVSELILGGHKLFTGIIRDLTYEKNIEDGLYIAKEEADAASKAKSEFLASMSHELRTPLNAILGFSSTMKEGIFGPVGNEKYLEYAGDIFQSGTHLLDLINDVLDVSAIEAGKLSLHESDIDIPPLIDEVVRLVEPKSLQKKISLQKNVAVEGARLFADERRIKQILLNLLTNAIKFTPEEKQISITASVTVDNEMEFTVADNGIGMTDDEIETALTPFGQIENAALANEGTGLGLPLTKAMIEAHGGSLLIESDKNKGSTFIVRFPQDRLLKPEQAGTVS